MIMIGQFSPIRVDSVNYQVVELSRLCSYCVGKVLTGPLKNSEKMAKSPKRLPPEF